MDLKAYFNTTLLTRFIDEDPDLSQLGELKRREIEIIVRRVATRVAEEIAERAAESEKRIVSEMQRTLQAHLDALRHAIIHLHTASLRIDDPALVFAGSQGPVAPSSRVPRPNLERLRNGSSIQKQEWIMWNNGPWSEFAAVAIDMNG